MLRAGNLRTRLTIQAKVLTPDGQGGNTVTWQTVGNAWGEVLAERGSESQQSDQTVSSVPRTIRTRYREGLAPSMRLSDGRRVFSIRAIADPDARKAELLIDCVELIGEFIVQRGAANLTPGDVGLGGHGDLIFGNGAGTLHPDGPTLAAGGALVFPSNGALAPTGPTLTAAGLIDRIAQDIEAVAGLTLAAYYDGRYGVRLSGTAPMAWDDRRASTNTGRCAFVIAAGADRIECGDYTGLNGVTSATITGRFVAAASFASARTLCSRYGATAASNRQFRVTFSTAGKAQLIIGTPSTFTWTGNDTFAIGTLHDLAFVFDGSIGTDLGKVVLYYRSFDPVTQTWSAESTDTGASATASFPASLITVTGENVAIGRDRSNTAGSNAWRGLIDDIKIFPSASLTANQRTAAHGNDPLAANWVTPSFWHDLASTTHRGSSGSAFNATLFGDVVFCSDDTAVARTALAFGTTQNPAYSSTTKRLTFDGSDDCMRAHGGPIKGITQDCALIVVGVSPQSGVRLAELSVGTTSHALMQSRSTTNLRATTNATNADIPNGTGLRVWMARRTGTGTVTIGHQNGTASEVTATGSPGNFVPDVVTIGADLQATPSNFGDCEIAAVLVVKGNFAAHQSLITSWAPTFHGASV